MLVALNQEEAAALRSDPETRDARKSERANQALEADRALVIDALQKGPCDSSTLQARSGLGRRQFEAARAWLVDVGRVRDASGGNRGRARQWALVETPR